MQKKPCIDLEEKKKRIQYQVHEDLLEPLLAVASAHGSWYLGKAPL